MTSDDVSLRRTPLYDVALSAGGRMVPFGGWEMAVQFAGIKSEHGAVRQGVGLFDISHMGQITVAGERAEAFLDHLLPARIKSLVDGQMLYAPMCNERGGCVDDVVAYRQAEGRYMLVVNASRLQADWSWVTRKAEGWAGVELEDWSQARGMVALQGPRAEEVVSGLAGSAAASLPYYHCRQISLGGGEALLSRNGYTGEDGFEIMAAADRIADLWALLVDAGAVPCGLGARDTLRMEMGFCLYGNELDEETTPLEAGLGWTVDFAKEADFIGAEKLARMQQVGDYRRLRGFKMLDKGIPRAGYALFDAGGREVGTVTSGTQSPTLDQGIGLGYLERGAQKVGTQIYVDMRGKKKPAVVVKLPFVQAGVKRD